MSFREDVSRWLSRTRGQERHPGDAATPRARGEIWALRDVSLKIAHGEIVGLIGVNGAGKSTLLKILSRITAPTTGRVVLHGRVGSLLEVGTGFHPELTGHENIFLNGAILGMSRQEVRERLDDIIAFAEMERFIHTPVKRYSSGMTVRLAFAVAAHLESEIMIVDEVLAVGDAAFQKKCIDKMRDVAGAGRTIILVSHNLSTISRICERGIWMDQGKVRMDGDVLDVIEQYERSSSVGMEADQGSGADSSTGCRIQSVGVLNPAGEPLQSVESGAPIVLEVRGISTRDYEDLSVAIGIYDNTGRRLALLDSAIQQTRYRIAEGEFRLRCDCAGLALVSGRYALNVAISQGPDLVNAAQRAGHLQIGEPALRGAQDQSGPLLARYDWRRQT